MLSLAIAATILLLTAGVATAATSNIEGIWSFNGGEIAIQPEGNGKFEGIVVSPTNFKTCTHPVGQKIWKEMTPQADGSYLGLHQWYKSTPSGEDCTEEPAFVGPTAWRVVEETSGSRYLRVCFSRPGTAAPSIPPGSEGVGATFGCTKSALIASLPAGNSGTAGLKETLSLPSSKQCLSARLFIVHLRDPKYDPFKKVLVTIKGKKIKTTRRGGYIVATINLKGYPAGKFTLKIAATTVLGHHLSGSRTYHTCAKKAKKSRPKKLG